MGVRLLTRILAESINQNVTSAKAVVLIGAGFAAQMILRELQHPGSGYEVIGCLDDDRSKRGVRIQGVPVAGTVDELPLLFKGRTDYEVIIAVPSANTAQMRRFVKVCEQAGVKFRTVPALRELISGEVTVKHVRDVNLDDLLGRDVVQIDLEFVKEQLHDKSVMVTGAAGSIGAELCRQILGYAPRELVCVDQNETGIFSLQSALGTHTNGCRTTCYVANVGNHKLMHSVLCDHQVEVVFHAAAYKHVPIMESNVSEAVRNNVLTLIELLEAAERSGCRRFVMISSDKAVNPTSVMGASKRICELVVSSRPANNMHCVSVRFGNVLGSSGSVVTVLQQQLNNHQPLTITHPDVKRFFMTTREAVTLVLQAFAMGNHGDIMVLDMGEPVRIVDLARSLIRLSGKSEQEVGIRFTGLREGEKLFEELFYEQERISPTPCEKIKRTNGALRDWSKLSQQLEQLRASMTQNGAASIRATIQEIVPEYKLESRLLESAAPCSEPSPPHKKAAAQG